jgi:hypothetical protein
LYVRAYSCTMLPSINLTAAKSNQWMMPSGFSYWNQ